MTIDNLKRIFETQLEHILSECPLYMEINKKLELKERLWILYRSGYDLGTTQIEFEDQKW